MLAAVLKSTEKKRILWPFLSSKLVKFSVLLIKLNFFVVDPSPLLFYFFIRSELFRPGLAVRVDPVRLLNLHFSSMLFIRKLAWPAHSSATQAIKTNTLDQITGKVIDVSRTHIPLKPFDDSLETCEIERCSGHRHSPQKRGLGSFDNIITS